MENQVMKALLERRSCRKYKSDPVPDGLLDQITAAGLNAASGMGRQSAIIIQVTNKTLRDQLAALNADIMGASMDPFYGAPAVL
ncbi:MAG: nitroreductase family protein, partial [Pseudoramibacter sp.]